MSTIVFGDISLTLVQSVQLELKIPSDITILYYSQSFQVVDRASETQLEVAEKLNRRA